jgi:hypothetical protein
MPVEGTCITEGAEDWGPENGAEQSQPTDNDPVSWITTEQLDDESFNAEVSSATSDAEDFEEIDEYLRGDEEYEDEALGCAATWRALPVDTILRAFS